MSSAERSHEEGVKLPLRDWARLAGAFSALGIMLFSPALFSWYASDDFLHYATVIEGGLPFWPGPSGGGFLRPLVGLSFWLDYQFWGLHPLLPHLLNIATHVGNSLLVIKLALVVQAGHGRPSRFGPMAAGLLFLVLGCHAEVVSWISCRGDLFSTFFVLLMLISFCTAYDTDRGRPWVLSLIFMGLALLSKESAFAAPFLAMLCMALMRGSATRSTKSRRCMMALSAHVLLVGIYFLFRRAMLGSFVGGYGAHGHLRTQPDLVAQALGHFLLRVFLPPLPDRVLDALPTLQGALGLAWLACLIVLLLSLAWRLWHRPTPAVFSALAFFGALLPVFNVRIYLSEIEGERYLYLASVFAAMGVGFGLAHLRVQRTRVLVIAALALFQAAVLFSGVQHWRGAATIARTIVSGIQEQHEGGTILLVNKPDTYNGALVFRTGLPEALAHFGPRPIDAPEVEALFAAGIYQWNHGFSFGPADDGPAGAMRLRAVDTTSGFSEEDRYDRISVVRKESNRAVFVFREPLRDVEVFYYDAGGVKAVDLTELTSQAPTTP
jgi:hypothetical protein